MALTKEGLAVYRCFLLAPAGALLAAGIDPIEVYKRCGDWAFDPAAEEIAETHRRRNAADVAGEARS